VPGSACEPISFGKINRSSGTGSWWPNWGSGFAGRMYGHQEARHVKLACQTTRTGPRRWILGHRGGRRPVLQLPTRWQQEAGAEFPERKAHRCF
jgi:hypothetical protein